MRQTLMKLVGDFSIQMKDAVNESTTIDDFIEYEYTQNDLEEFIAFAIKTRMQGINSSEPPRLKDLRVNRTGPMVTTKSRRTRTPC